MKRQDAARLAAQHELGTPQRIYSLNIHVFLDIGCSIIFLGLGLLAGLLVVTAFVSFVQHPEIIASLWFRWVEAFLGSLALFFWFFLLLKDSRRFRNHYECECTNGFLLMRGKDPSKVKILKWENIQQIEERRVRVGKRRGRPNASLYYVYDRQGHLYQLEHRKLWKRCAAEIARRKVPEVHKSIGSERALDQ